MFLTLGKSTVTALSSSFSTCPYRIGTRRTAFAEERAKLIVKKKELLEATETVQEVDEGGVGVEGIKGILFFPCMEKYTVCEIAVFTEKLPFVRVFLG